MPRAFDCLLTITVCERPKLSSWQLISSFLFLHCVVDQCPVVKKPTQNAMIMSCQMPITGNSVSQCMVDETVTHCQPSSRSSLSFMSHLSNYIRVGIFFLFPSVNVTRHQILIDVDLCCAQNISMLWWLIAHSEALNYSQSIKHKE